MTTSPGVKQFIKKHALATVAIGFLIAHSVFNFIETSINGFVMPLIQPLLGNAHWSEHTVNVGPFSFQWGPPVAAGIHLLVAVGLVLIVIKILEFENE